MRAISYQDEVERAVLRGGSGRLFVAAVLYREALGQVPEFTYYKALERMVERRKLIRLAKGIYICPEAALGVREITQEIIRYYTACRGERFAGFCAGADLLEKYSIIGGRKEGHLVYTALLPERRKQVQDVRLLRYPAELSAQQVQCAQFMEIVSLYPQYAKSGDFNSARFFAYVKEFAVGYRDESMLWVLRQKDYPKHTVAFAELLLRGEGCKTGIAQLLPGTSKYKLPRVGTA